jgi:hypothetical protein
MRFLAPIYANQGSITAQPRFSAMLVFVQVLMLSHRV